MTERTHWDKAIQLIELVKTDPEARRKIREGSREQVEAVLTRVGLERADLSQIAKDVTLIRGEGWGEALVFWILQYEPPMPASGPGRPPDAGSPPGVR
jgi:hypothetical protein